MFSFLSGSPYYDNVRPLSYPDSDAVLICFDISRPETLDSVLKKVCGSFLTRCVVESLAPLLPRILSVSVVAQKGRIFRFGRLVDVAEV